MEPHDVKKLLAEKFRSVLAEVTDPYLPQSEFKDTEGVVTTAKPTVIIGLGGAGTKSVARLKSRIQEFYRGPEFESERKSLAFLLMDTLSFDNVMKEDTDAARFIYRMFSRDDYTYLGGFSPGQYLQAQMKSSRDLQSWWDNSYNPPQAEIEEGAKRVRQLGRLALYRSKETVRTSIRTAINNAVTIHASLVRDGKARGLGGQAQNIYFYIFSGTCGGTGSGTLLDTIYFCYSLASELGRVPIIRLVLFMPRLFIEEARKMPDGGFLGRAFAANAYALFKELQYLVTDGDTIDRWRLDAKEADYGDNRPPRGWKPDRIYLIDTEIAGKEIGVGQFDQLYTLAADYMFQAIVTPAGFVLEHSLATNIDGVLGTRSGGRPNGFSSVGVSYIVFPSRTIARSLSCRLLKETLVHIGRTPLSEDEKKAIITRGKDAYSSLSDFLEAPRIDERLLQGTDVFIRAIPDGGQLLQRMERERTKASELLKKAMDTGKEQGVRGKCRVAENFEDFGSLALKQIAAKLKETVSDLMREGLDVAQGVISQLGTQVAAQSASMPASPLIAERAVIEGIRRVGDMESRWFMWRRQSKIEDAVQETARRVREETDLAIKGHAADKRISYLREAATKINDALDQIKRIRLLLTSFKDELEDWCKLAALEDDETSVSITTGYVPKAPSNETFEDLYERSGVIVPGFAKGLFASQTIRTNLWDLGATQEKDVQAALELVLQEAMSECVAQVGAPWLRKRVTEIIQENWGNDPARFKETYGQNLLNLCDPSWALRRDAIPQREQCVILTSPVPAYPKEGFSGEKYLPQDLLAQPSPGDPRMIVVLRSEHGAPLFAVRGVMALHEAYRERLRDYKAHGEAPPHINREWNKSEDALDDVGPRKDANTEEMEAFAQGLFCDWLVREKKDTRILAAMADRDLTGPISLKGARGNYFYVSYELREDKKLHRRGEVPLKAKQRYEAAQAVDPNAKAAVAFFMTKLNDLYSASELRPLVDEYLDYLKTKYAALSELMVLDDRQREEKLRDEPDSNKRSLLSQLLRECEIILTFKDELSSQ